MRQWKNKANEELIFKDQSRGSGKRRLMKYLYVKTSHEAVEKQGLSLKTNHEADGKQG